MPLRHLQDDFLPPEEGLSSKIREYLGNLGGDGRVYAEV